MNYLLLTYCTLVSCLAFYSTLKMEDSFSSETSVDIRKTIRQDVPEDSILHNYRCKNIESYSLKCNFSSFPEQKIYNERMDRFRLNLVLAVHSQSHCANKISCNFTQSPKRTLQNTTTITSVLKVYALCQGVGMAQSV
jgi:hypothetical protein